MFWKFEYVLWVAFVDCESWAEWTNIHMYINLNIYFVFVGTVFIKMHYSIQCIYIKSKPRALHWALSLAVSLGLPLFSYYAQFLASVSCIPSFSTTRRCVVASVAYVPKITCCLFCCFSVYSYKLLRARQQMSYAYWQLLWLLCSQYSHLLVVFAFYL